MEQTTCAACTHLATNLYPWWYYLGMVVCLMVIVGALALVNWMRWMERQA